MSSQLSAGYYRFAESEARNASPLYEALAIHVAESDLALEFLSRLRPEKQQPNLFFAATRHVAGTPANPEHFDQLIRDHGDEIADVMNCRTTQTNEPGRCAALLPLLSNIEGPIALIEVGASAGLCLLPDKYGYRYGEQVLEPPQDMRSLAPFLACRASNNTPIPKSLPSIVWRAGLDLNPLDVDQDADESWLQTLVWPEQTERLERLNAAINVARKRRPRLIQGDLRRDLPDLVREAPADATLVIFHTAVLAYLSSQEERK